MKSLSDFGINDYKDAFEASGATVLKFREWEIAETHDTFGFTKWLAKVEYEGKTGWTHGILSPHLHTPLTDLHGSMYSSKKQATQFVKEAMEKHFLRNLSPADAVFENVLASFIGSENYRKVRKMRKFLKA